MTNEILYFLLDLFFFSVVEGIFYTLFFKIFAKDDMSFTSFIKSVIFVSLIVFISPRILENSPFSQILICVCMILYFYKFYNVDFRYSFIYSTLSVSFIIISDILILSFYCTYNRVSCVNIYERFIMFIISRIFYFILMGGVLKMKTLLGGITRR